MYQTELYNIAEHPNEIYVLQEELTYMVPQHTHEQGHILVVLDGMANVDIEHDSYFIPNGYFVWIPENTPHRISFDSTSIKILNIYYPHKTQYHKFYENVGVYSTPSILYHTLELVQDKTKSYSQTNWQYELLMTLNHTLPHIIETFDFKLRIPTNNNPIIEKITKAIHHNYQNKITAEEICKEVGISERTMNRYMRKELNTSFLDYLRLYRILMSIKLMVNKKESISSIAYCVGYDSLTAFSNAFYRVTGKRPSHFF